MRGATDRGLADASASAVAFNLLLAHIDDEEEEEGSPARARASTAVSGPDKDAARRFKPLAEADAAADEPKKLVKSSSLEAKSLSASNGAAMRAEKFSLTYSGGVRRAVTAAAATSRTKMGAAARRKGKTKGRSGN